MLYLIFKQLHPETRYGLGPLVEAHTRLMGDGEKFPNDGVALDLIWMKICPVLHHAVDFIWMKRLAVLHVPHDAAHAGQGTLSAR